MSKITRLEQLKNENSLYRVSGVFEKSEICSIFINPQGNYVVWAELSMVVGTFTQNEFQAKLTTGSISIMCLQRGEE